MHLWASLYTLTKLNGTSITFVLLLLLRKRLSCLIARAAYHASGNASGVGKRFAHGRFANTQLSRTFLLTPPSNRLSFTTLGASRGSVHILSEQHEHGERRVLDRPRSGEHPGKSSTVGSTSHRLSAPSVRRHTRGGRHQCLVRVQPHASGGSALQLA